MSIEVHIEELVLDGVDGVDERELGRALERELTRRLAEGTLDAEHLRRLGRTPPVREIELPAAAGGAALGASTAEALAGLLGAATSIAEPTTPPRPLEGGGRVGP